MRTTVAREAPRRIASTRIQPARTAPAASPAPGMRPRIGSRPNRTLVPGIRMPASNQYANFETATKPGVTTTLIGRRGIGVDDHLARQYGRATLVAAGPRYRARVK